ncbi:MULTISPECIES: restriction endonuclease subunit S [Streptomyces]|uniref:restriction endonuclease subunit S n=1 Tax=Streptomyces TaxID=1883 RepID=UPI001E316AF2|nr:MULTISPECIES: restriction endonuclease subunit S [Streptomyces]UFQ14848.1 restriction endonuclease subunit S [Streptomyces huasconensis]WCL84452.1 restriction endonuclease subunit S [Streptomyces sp. JCM 35825]
MTTDSGVRPGGSEADGVVTDELPMGWTRATIGELCEVNPRGFDEEPDDDDVISQVPMAAVEAATGRMDASTQVRYGDFKKKSLTRFQENDILFAKITPCMENGKIAKAQGLTGGRALGSTEFHVLRSRGAVLPDYLLRFLLQRHVRRMAEQHMTGAVGQRRVPRPYLAELEIPLPPLSEQHRITAKLGDQLTHVEAGEAALALAAERYEHLIHAARSQGVWPTGENSLPEGWRWGVVGDVLEKIQAGKSFTCLPRVARDDEWGVIKVSAMTWGEFRADENKALPPEREPNPDYEIHSGDILVSRANTVDYVGAPVLVGETRSKLMLSDKSLRLVPKAGVDRDWLIEVLSSRPVRAQYSAAATGTSDSMRNISQVTVRSARIPIPPEGVAQKNVAAAIADAMNLVRPLKGQLDEQAREAGRLRDALLHAAFTGALVPQNPDDEPATALLDRIRAQRAVGAKPARGKRAPRTTSPAAPPALGRPVSSGTQETLPL